PRRFDLETRAAQLLARYEQEWLGPLRGSLADWSFRRGFLDWIHADAALIVQEGERALRDVPVWGVVLANTSEAIEELGINPVQTRVRGLELPGPLHPGLAALFASLDLGNLQTLAIGSQPLDSRALDVIVALPRLTHLTLHVCGLGLNHLETLAASPA